MRDTQIDFECFKEEAASDKVSSMTSQITFPATPANALSTAAQPYYTPSRTADHILWVGAGRTGHV